MSIYESFIFDSALTLTPQISSPPPPANPNLQNLTTWRPGVFSCAKYFGTWLNSRVLHSFFARVWKEGGEEGWVRGMGGLGGGEWGGGREVVSREVDSRVVDSREMDRREVDSWEVDS